MSEYCVVVAEGSRARFFTLEPADLPEFQSGPNLVEHDSLANPLHKAHQQKIFSDTRSGRNRNPATGGVHGYDEHRQGYDSEMEHRFARDIARELEGLTAANGVRHVVLCAEKRMLGFLRSALEGTLGNGVDLVEHPKDLAKMPARDVHDRLARQGLLPARRNRTASG